MGKNKIFLLNLNKMFDKKQLLLFLTLCFIGLGKAQELGPPIIKFELDTADFGIVQEGDSVVYDFVFTNIGKSDLVIKQAWPACGCTHPSFTKGPIKPGEKGVIHVKFLSAGWGGHSVVKEVIIISNAAENYARFKAVIIKKSDVKRGAASLPNKAPKKKHKKIKH